MGLNYVYEKVKQKIAKLSLCYVRVRCPCCGMWTRLDNLKREQPLYEESTCYSMGDRGFFHDKKVNPSLKAFWINRLKHILDRMGFEIPHEFEVEIPYQRPVIGMPVYRFEKEVSYGYER